MAFEIGQKVEVTRRGNIVKLNGTKAKVEKGERGVVAAIAEDGGVLAEFPNCSGYVRPSNLKKVVVTDDTTAIQEKDEERQKSKADMIRELLDQGLSRSAIAKQVGVRYQYVYQVEQRYRKKLQENE